MKNKTKLSTLTLALVACVLTGCDSEVTPEVPVVEEKDNITKISLDRYYASMFYSDKDDSKFNEEITLTPTVAPYKKGARKIVWTSSNEAVATVDQNGKVTAVGEGFAEITAANEDNTTSASTHIIVNNMNGSKLSYCNSRLNDIITKQNKDNFEMPDVITSYENYEQVITKNDVVISKTKFSQNITTSKDNAYVFLDIDETKWKVEGGSPEHETFSYCFYTNDAYISYLFKTSGLTKNYMSVNQSDYIGKGREAALKAICNNFFVSGDGIVTENYDAILSQKIYEQNWISSTDKNEHFARMANVPGQLAFDLREQEMNYAIDEDEDDMNIPVGTPYTMDVYDRLVFENFLLLGKYVDQTASYTIDGDQYKNHVIVDTYYKTGEEIVIPNKDSYQLVDSIFNL